MYSDYEKKVIAAALTAHPEYTEQDIEFIVVNEFEHWGKVRFDDAKFEIRGLD